jgi:hypothetical protein
LPQVRKLFVVSEEDRLRSAVEDIYARSTEPKETRIYPGSAHAQHVLRGEHERDLAELIVRFLRD